MQVHKQIYKVFLVEDDNGTLQRLAEVVRDEPGLELEGMAMNYTCLLYTSPSPRDS